MTINELDFTSSANMYSAALLLMLAVRVYADSMEGPTGKKKPHILRTLYAPAYLLPARAAVLKLTVRFQSRCSPTCLHWHPGVRVTFCSVLGVWQLQKLSLSARKCVLAAVSGLNFLPLCTQWNINIPVCMKCEISCILLSIIMASFHYTTQWWISF